MQNDSFLTLRLPKSDKQKLLGLAKKERLTLSSYVRSKILSRYV